MKSRVATFQFSRSHVLHSLSRISFIWPLFLELFQAARLDMMRSKLVSAASPQALAKDVKEKLKRIQRQVIGHGEKGPKLNLRLIQA